MKLLGSVALASASFFVLSVPAHAATEPYPPSMVYVLPSDVNCSNDEVCAQQPTIEILEDTISGAVSETIYYWQGNRTCSYEYIRPSGTVSGEYCRAPVGTQSLSGLGANVAAALGVSVGSAGSPVVNGGVLGTPSSGNLTNTVGYYKPVATVAALKTLPSPDVVLHAQLQEFYSGLGVGGGNFDYYAVCPFTPDNGMYFITSLGGTTCWGRSTIDPYLHSSWYGVKTALSDSATMTSNVSRLNTLGASAFLYGKGVFFDCGAIYLNSPVYFFYPDNGTSIHPSQYALEVTGCGSGGAYVVGSAKGSSLISTTAPVLWFYKGTTFTTDSPVMDVHGFQVYGNTANPTATTPLIEFDVFQNYSRLHDVQGAQAGEGDGVYCNNCFSASMDNNLFIGKTINISPPVTRYGTAFHIHVGGTGTGGQGSAFTLAHNKAHGVLWGFEVGDGATAGNNTPLNYVIKENEVDTSTGGIWVHRYASKTSVLDNHDEIVDGDFIRDDGIATTVARNGLFFGGFTRGIAGNPNHYTEACGGDYHDNIIHVNSNSSIGIDAYDTCGTTIASNHVIYTGSGTTTNSIGIKIASIGTYNISGLNSNDYGTDPWSTGSGSAAFDAGAAGYPSNLSTMDTYVTGPSLTATSATLTIPAYGNKFAVNAASAKTITSIVNLGPDNRRVTLYINSSTNNVTIAGGGNILTCSPTSFTGRTNVKFDLEGSKAYESDCRLGF